MDSKNDKKVQPRKRQETLEYLLGYQANDPVAMQRRLTQRHFFLKEVHQLPEHHRVIRVSIYPQDPFVSEPVIRRVAASDLQPGPKNNRFRVRDSRKIEATPTNAAGDYIYDPSDPEFDQVNALYYATLTLRMFERYMNRPISWAFESNVLDLDPCIGTLNANAFYSASEEKVGFFMFDSRLGELRTSQSADIVAHEVAHAVLDGLRDLLNASFSFGPEAFHETFADMSAILVALHDDGLVERLLTYTKGDLRIASFITCLHEELGKTLHKLDDDPRNNNTFYLRNALNDFTAIPFDDLVYMPNDPLVELGREAHNYSRVYTGALYEILVRVYESYRDNYSDATALALARDFVGSVLTRSIDLSPIAESSLPDFGQALLAADILFFDGEHEVIIREVLIQRQVLTEQQAELNGLIDPPTLELPADVTLAEEAHGFIDQHRDLFGVEADTELHTQLGYRDADGNYFITYFTVEHFTLEGSQFGDYNGVEIPLFGGVVTVYDSQRRLIYKHYRPVTDEDREQVKQQLRDMIGYHHIAFGVSTLSGSNVTSLQTMLALGGVEIRDQEFFETLDPSFKEGLEDISRSTGQLVSDVVRVSLQGIQNTSISTFFEAWRNKLNQ